MSYPQIVDYNEAVQNPRASFSDPDLKAGTVSTTPLGLPQVFSGGFALTYTITTSRQTYAVRCFHRQNPSAEERYDFIAHVLAAQGNSYFVRFDYQPTGIRVRAREYPIVRMDWVEGDTLGVYLDRYHGHREAMLDLRNRFRELSEYLSAQQFAHGDLQNGNIIISSGCLRLIDYDGMYVPGLPIGEGSESGHKHFQHPRRSERDYGPKMDRFSLVAIDVSLTALAEDPSLYRRFCQGGETIIFSANDFADPSSSAVFRILWGMPPTREQANRLANVCGAPIASVPSLQDFIAGRGIPSAGVNLRGIEGLGGAPARRNYIAANPVVDASRYVAAASRVGQRVELIGRIVGVRQGRTRHGKPYVFLNFADWRGNAVKIAIWSAGLATFPTKPSESWVGRWISVTGLLDPPYVNPNYGYSHISITVNNASEVQQLQRVDAEYRLSARPKTEPITSSAADTPPRSVPPSSTSQRNTSILNQIRASSSAPRAAAQSSSTGPARSTISARSTPPSQRPHNTSSADSVIGCFGIIALFALLWIVHVIQG
jgi:hypothetical protein